MPNNNKSGSKGTKNSTPAVSLETIRAVAAIGKTDNDTYRIKDGLKEAGAKWSPTARVWVFSSEKKAKETLKGLKAGAGVTVGEVDLTLLVGNTYPYRYVLPAFGGKFERAFEGWGFTDTKAAQRAFAALKVGTQ